MTYESVQAVSAMIGLFVFIGLFIGGAGLRVLAWQPEGVRGSQPHSVGKRR